MTPSFSDDSTASFCLTINFEGIRGRVPESRVYALNAEGEIIASQRINGGKAEMTLPVEVLPGTTMAIGPAFALPDASVHRPVTRALHPFFNTDWEFVPGTSHYALPSVPENMWRWWLVRSLHGTLWPEPQRQRRFMMF